MRFTRIATAIAVVLLVLVAAATVAAAAFGERLLAAAIERVGPSLVGRKVSAGGVAIDWGRLTTIAVSDLAVADAAWSAGPAMLRVRKTELTIDLLDLLRLRLSPVRLGLRGPVLHLARNAQGRWNLPRAESGAGTSGGRAAGGFDTLREIEVENGELTVDDLASPGVEGRIAALSARAPRAADGVEFDGMVSRHGGTPVAFSGRIGSVAELLRGGDGGAEPFPVRLTLGPETARLSAAGHLARPLELAGLDLRIRGQGDDLAPLLAALAAAPAAATPPFHLTARLKDTERGWELEDLAARMGESGASGKASLAFGRQRRPRLALSLVAPRAVLSDFGWLASVGRRGEPAPGSLVDTPLPTAWLGWADAEGDLRVERLEGLAAGPAGLRLGFEADRGRLHVQPLRLGLAQGGAEGNATIDISGDAPPRIALRMSASNMQIGPLLAAVGIDRVSGTLASASVDLRGRGATPREVAAALDGGVRLRMVDGSIDAPGLSHVSMGLFETLGFVLGSGGGNAAPTPVTCAVGDFPVRRGVVHAERLVVVTPSLVIAGEGTARLDEATVRLTLVPKPIDEAFLRVLTPVVISGSLFSPEVATHPELRAGVRPEPADGICRDGSDHR